MSLNILANGYGMISETPLPTARRSDELPAALTDRRSLLKLKAIAFNNGRQIMIASSLLAKLDAMEIEKILER